MTPREHVLALIESLGYDPKDVAQVILTPGNPNSITVLHHPTVNRATRNIDFTASRHDG